MAWAIRRRNGGIDGNEELEDALVEPPWVDQYGQWIEVAPMAEVEALRDALDLTMSYVEYMDAETAAKIDAVRQRVEPTR